MYSNYDDNEKKKFLLKEYIDNQKSFLKLQSRLEHTLIKLGGMQKG